MLGYLAAAALCVAAVLLVRTDVRFLADVPGLSSLWSEQCMVSGGRLMSKEELSSYDGRAASPGLYLAVLGQVFDVYKGSKHYGPGGSYSFFAGAGTQPRPRSDFTNSKRVLKASLHECVEFFVGRTRDSRRGTPEDLDQDHYVQNELHSGARDASRAYVTGDFAEQGLVDDVSELSPTQMLHLHNWYNFYQKNYTPVGKLIGRFYDEQGNPTKALEDALGIIDIGLKLKEQRQEENKQFPPCNSEFSAGVTKVWCSKHSGGIQRDWVGVPRKLYLAGYDGYRCVCVRTTGPPSEHLESKEHNDKGDLDNPSLQEYKDCNPLFDWCLLKE